MKSYKTNNSLYIAGQAGQIMNTLRQWLSDYGPDMQMTDLLQKTQKVVPFIRKGN